MRRGQESIVNTGAWSLSPLLYMAIGELMTPDEILVWRRAQLGIEVKILSIHDKDLRRMLK